uniref:Uncharacterized protein n=1 Tax=Lotus japonicus TaxID=34305 RepID=I3T7H4_LOTJA|nr:unknown [Lotus japonicus]
MDSLIIGSSRKSSNQALSLAIDSVSTRLIPTISSTIRTQYPSHPIAISVKPIPSPPK